MRDELKTELTSLLDSYDQGHKYRRERQEESKAKRVDFVQAFYRAREEIIWPAMHEIKQVILQNAHDARIVQEDDEYQSAGGKQAEISLYIYPGGEGADSTRAHDYPYLSFTANWHARSILINGNTHIPGRDVKDIGISQGSSGLRGKCSVDELTKEFVQEEIVKLMKEVF